MGGRRHWLLRLLATHAAEHGSALALAMPKGKGKKGPSVDDELRTACNIWNVPFRVSCIRQWQ